MRCLVLLVALGHVAGSREASQATSRLRGGQLEAHVSQSGGEQVPTEADFETLVQELESSVEDERASTDQALTDALNEAALRNDILQSSLKVTNTSVADQAASRSRALAQDDFQVALAAQTADRAATAIMGDVFAELNGTLARTAEQTVDAIFQDDREIVQKAVAATSARDDAHHLRKEADAWGAYAARAGAQSAADSALTSIQEMRTSARQLQAKASHNVSLQTHALAEADLKRAAEAIEAQRVLDEEAEEALAKVPNTTAQSAAQLTDVAFKVLGDAQETARLGESNVSDAAWDYAELVDALKKPMFPGALDV